MRNITIIGSGYVGFSLAVLLSKKNKVISYDIDKERVNKINSNISPIEDKEIQDSLEKDNLMLKATVEDKIAFKNPEFIIIATPTNFNPISNEFDTKSVDESIKKSILLSPKATIVIKSTVPIGFTKDISIKYNTSNIFFSPEFLREGKALKDNLEPSRIIIGSHCKNALEFSKILIEPTLNKDNVEILFCESSEAEAIKLFANTYLAMRISFFNELDSFCEHENLNAKNVIDGVSLDHRIGSHYNNPSFGYGGYCLPKDTKQLLSNFKSVPNSLMQAIVNSNTLRKDYIAKSIIEKKPKSVGVYRLVMKKGSDNFRESAIQGIISRLIESNINIVIYEPNFKEKYFQSIKILNNLDLFKSSVDLIIANRIEFLEDLEDVMEKVYTRDIYGDG